MSSSEIPVLVRCKDPMAEVMLLDHLFQPISKGVGEVQAQVEPGIYLARAVAGNGVEEKPLVLGPDESGEPIDLPVVRFDSPIPLANTRTASQDQQALVSEALASSAGADAEHTGGFLLCVRDPSPSLIAGALQSAHERAYRGFRLLGESGDLLLDYDQIPSALRPAERLLLHKKALSPGKYQIEWQAAERPAMRIPLVVRPGMTTQLYVLLIPSGTETALWTADLENAAMAFGPNGRPFAPDSGEMRLAERARYCLTRGATLITNPAMEALLSENLDNPMLGVLAAHLLLLEAEPRLDLIEAIIRNTAKKLGDDLPDLVALKLRLAALAPAKPASRHLDLVPIAFPPLLRSSWNYLIEESSRTPELIPSDSFAYRISRALVSNGIWMAWRRERAADLSPPSPPADVPVTEVLGGVLAPSRPPRGYRHAISLDAWMGKAFRYLLRNRTPSGDQTAEVQAHRDRLKRTLGKTLGESGSRELAAAGDEQRDPVERARDLLDYLVRTVDWEQAIRQLRHRETGSRLSAGLSDLEKALLPALDSAKRYLDSGGELDRRFVEGMARSLAVPPPVLLEGLADLARHLVRIALGKSS